MQPEDDETPLRSLFDATAPEADGARLSRLSAKSADVPARARRARLTFRVLLPAMAVAAGIALALALHGPAGTPGGAAPAAATTREPGARSAFAAATPRAPKPATPRDPSNGDEVESEDELLADLDPGLDAETLDDDLGLDVLDEPADDDIDSWLDATGGLEGDG